MTDDALLYVDASTDRVGISTSAPSHGFHCDTGMGYPVATKTSGVTMASDERVIYLDSTSSSHEITLPSAVIGRVVEVYRKDDGTSGNTCGILRGGSDTINGSTSSLTWSTQYEGYRCVCVETGAWIAHYQTVTTGAGGGGGE